MRFVGKDKNWINVRFSHNTFFACERGILFEEMPGGGTNELAFFNNLFVQPRFRFNRWTLDSSAPYSAWIAPAIVWGIFLFAMYGALICLVALVRRQWVEHERLPFPLAQIQIALVEDERGRARLSRFVGLTGEIRERLCLGARGRSERRADDCRETPGDAHRFSIRATSSWPRAICWRTSRSFARTNAMFALTVGVAFWTSSCGAFPNVNNAAMATASWVSS